MNPNCPTPVEYFLSGGDHLNSNNFNKDVKLDFLLKPYILFVGSRAKYKNFKILIKALTSSKRLLNDFNLVLFDCHSWRFRN